MALKILDLFSGIGGFTLAGEIAGGYQTIAFCEIDKGAQDVLRKNWPNIPIFEDIRKLKGNELGTVDVITGGFPCQDISISGLSKGIGQGTRSGLFIEMLRLAEECQRPYLIFENVTRLLSGPTQTPGQWFGDFLHSLASIGYDAEWMCLAASAFGGPHERKRLCVVAYPNEASIKRGGVSSRIHAKHSDLNRTTCWWRESSGPQRRIYRMDDGVSLTSHRSRSGMLGNAIVPPVFSVVLEALRDEIMSAIG